MDPRPPGGFLNYLHSQQYSQLAQQFPLEIFYFVGIPGHHAPFTPPAFQGSPLMTGPDSGTPSSVPHKQTKEHIDLDADDNGEAARTDKRLAWTHQEDVRLVNAWIENSNDPINGNSKKNDHYWSQVADVYNRNTPSNRRREASQFNVRWHRVSTKINNFHGCYESVRSVYVSGRFDPEVIADALLKYEADYGEPFKLCHWWKVLKNEPKWLTYCERLKKDKNSSPPSIVIDVVQDIPRPEGSKAAKANRNGKRKMPEMADEMRDELDKFIAAQTAAREDREGMKEFQLRISSEKLEAAKLARQPEKDKKEHKILDTYKELMLANTSGLDEDEKAERKKALKFMSLQLFDGEN
ncbi:glutathione S-transferase T3 isoform X1 [Brachypodium distachyon]|uniref:Uncharacterized protein n=1 Tax=Brachypodium distachyon TaxID=15368 RepID=A0A0Q3SCA4_BRADI|nr:glutathione S-transferase T3 isoform X1 [Brachypodium distachyon]XP_024313412.1 glutathione S-transferase T3 isoform X1 [Brachypodium distachyon]KQK22610.1 hypothetical protein BRADI_1g68367v3 [Brachypodium distachyon]|eukprot:XP_010228885.1 glutathione S-transferase T3 isoform X1 [Brachypodium distachyon]